MSEGNRTLDELLAEARARISRLSPAEALAAVDGGGLIVDIRSTDARRHTIVPGSIHVPRTVLEWRLEPDGAWRNPHVGDIERRLLVLCDHGYSSIFAAAILTELGYVRAGDIVGGFEAWAAAGLPVAPAPADRPTGEFPGMSGPD